MNNYETIDPIKVIKKLDKKMDERTIDLMDFAVKTAEDVCLVFFAGAEITTAVVYFATKSVGWAIAGRLIWLVTTAAVAKYARIKGEGHAKTEGKGKGKGKEDAEMPMQ